MQLIVLKTFWFYFVLSKERALPIEEAFDVPGELDEVVEAGVQQRVNAIEVDAEIAVDEHIAEAGDATEPAGKLGRQDAQLTEDIDGAGVVGGVAPGTGGQMRGDVEGVLRGQLEPTLHGPLGVGVERREWLAGVAPQPLDGLVEGQQVTADDGVVGLAGPHRPKRPASMRAAWAASILASWTT